MGIVAVVEVVGDVSDVLNLLRTYPVKAVGGNDLVLSHRLNTPIALYVQDKALQDTVMTVLEHGGSWCGVDVVSVTFKRAEHTTCVGNHTHIIANPLLRF